VILDVGANVGRWTQWTAAQARHARIHAFESDPRAYEALERATRDLHNVERHRIALGSREGTATLYAVGDLTPLSSLHQRELGAFGLETAASAEVTLTTADAFCAEHGIAHVGFIKADVEGHEHDLISGAAGLLAEGAIDVLQFEYGGTYIDAGRRLSDVLRLVPPDRYAIFKLVPWGVMPVEPADLREERFPPLELRGHLTAHRELRHRRHGDGAAQCHEGRRAPTPRSGTARAP
jgi:FkbM family methyltransferase